MADLIQKLKDLKYRLDNLNLDREKLIYQIDSEIRKVEYQITRLEDDIASVRRAPTHSPDTCQS